ncbi:2-hydroxyacid dehydrogenase [uncultured Algibacter sp.]|uniref:2-hydroxyacid dehydrogenase n=1 Tax=uncultured Algibacter sp. TaxID=298659 RepID=UPI00260F31EE|nr:2-hydroxyacid dehydrogenase [uncultured Algibacter sp.]
MKVLVYSAKAFEIPYLEDLNRGKHKLTFIEDSLTSDTAIKAIGYEAISIFSADNASNIVLEKLKDFGVKHITLRSAGFDNVNLFSAKDLGVKVANVPAYSPHAIAEHAVAILMALNRHILLSNERVKRFNFDINNLVGFDLNNKTVGILGTGKIGSVMTKIMHGFGCKLLGFDINENKNLSEQYHLKYVSLNALCKEADIISIHLPLNTETQYLINKKTINLMKPNCLIINTARGAVINSKDLLDALINKDISGFATDVYEHEKSVFFKDRSFNIPEDNILIRLNALPNVLITGHHAFLTDEALTNIAETTIYNLDCWSDNKESENELHF